MLGTSSRTLLRDGVEGVVAKSDSLERPEAREGTARGGETLGPSPLDHPTAFEHDHLVEVVQFHEAV